MSPQGDETPPERPDDPERPDPPEQEEPERPEPPEQAEPERPEKPEYTVYGSKGGKSGQKRPAPERKEPEEKPGAPGRPDKPEYKVYRSRPSLRDRLRKPDFGGLKRPTTGPGLRGKLSSIGGERRWIRWVLIGIGAWLLLSFVTFAISAQMQKSDLPDSAKEALEGGPDVLAGQNILILGGDRRSERQGGSESQGPPRADTIMVLHAGLTSFRKLSIPRDTYASIPDCGEQRINASLACNSNNPDGNPASTIRTVSSFLGIDLHHIVIIDFEGFADFINTLGGIEVKIKSKVCGDVDGGKKQGGISIQLKAGTHTLEGDKALALARIRKNECQPDEDDTDRAARQQVLLNGIKGRLTSITRVPYNFIKGPWIGWNAPKAFISDMGGFTLPQVAIAAMFGGSGSTNVLGREPDGTLHVEAGPGGSLSIPQGECERAVRDLTGDEPDREPECSPD